MQIDTSHFGVLPILAGTIRNQETGELRWPVIVGTIISAGTIGVSAWLVGLSGEIRSMSAKMDMLMQNQTKLESRIDPITLQCYTQEDAKRDRSIYDGMLNRVYERLNHLEGRRK